MYCVLLPKFFHCVSINLCFHEINKSYDDNSTENLPIKEKLRSKIQASGITYLWRTMNKKDKARNIIHLTTCHQHVCKRIENDYFLLLNLNVFLPKNIFLKNYVTNEKE
ncbi:Protein of unknown function [Gryllus bimaculatus]|nr:Protein of unknown function [Gryllus bimaculatus]